MATETIVAARRTRGTAGRRPRQRRLHHGDLCPLSVVAALALLTIPSAALSTATSTACGSVHFTQPAPDLTFFRHDTINVTYESAFAHPSLVCLCGQGGRVSEKFRLDNAAPFAASEAVLLNFDSVDPCWFHLEPGPIECGDADAVADHDTSDWDSPRSSPRFALWPRHHPPSRPPTTPAIPDDPQKPIAKRATISSPDPATTAPPAPTPTAPDSPAAPPDQRGGRPGLSPGATAGIGAGVAAVIAAAGAMAAFLYFRRRKKNQTADLADAIIDHDRRHGRRPPEKLMGWDNSSSAATARSDEPLYPAPQPIPDGFPGSMGYDDVRSLHSLHSTDAHSPTNGPSPNHTHAAAGYWTERDELSAARLKSQIPVTSYGPNPVTPTLTPRPSSRVDLNVRAGSVSTDSREGIPPMPFIPLMPDYSYSLPPREPSPCPKPPAATIPIVVSYGPNRVTPNPALPTPTVPPDESIYKRSKSPHFELHTIPSSRARTHDAWDDLDDDCGGSAARMTASAMGPLPPYASTADFYAMEKGAIRKMAEPRAEAELPPTKDGYYYGYGAGSEVVEYELQGGVVPPQPQQQQQVRYQGRRDQPPAAMGATLGGGGPRGGREVDEGKFLLSPELVMLKGEKMKRGRGKEEGASARGKSVDGRGMSSHERVSADGRGSLDGRGNMDARLW